MNESKPVKSLVVQLRMTEEHLDLIRRAANRQALDAAAWMRTTLVRQAMREAPQCWCGGEPAVHHVPGVRDLVGDRCLRATDWQMFAEKLPPVERKALLRHVSQLLVPRRDPDVKIVRQRKVAGS